MERDDSTCRTVGGRCGAAGDAVEVTDELAHLCAHRLVESVAAYGERSGKHEGAGLNAHLLGQGRQVDKRLLRIQFAEGQQEKGGKQRKMPKFHGRIKLVGLLRDKLHSGAKSVGE